MVVVVLVAESPVCLRWRGWREGVQARASLPREDRRIAGSSGTPPPRRGAATNPQMVVISFNHQKNDLHSRVHGNKF